VENDFFKEKKAMKTFVTVFVACLCLGLAVAEAGDTPWFDLENCVMCKNISGEDGLWENLTWETHLITNGMMSLTVVDSEYEEAYEKAKKGMQATGQELQSGKQMHLCGFCMSYGSLIMSGANMEAVETKAGEILLVTATDDAVVEQIQTHAKKTMEEYEKLHQPGHSGKAHQKHGH
jgi:hypothetical protein